MVNGTVWEMRMGMWTPVNSARKSVPEKLRIGYIYSAYNIRSQIFLAFSALYLFIIILGFHANIIQYAKLIAKDFFNLI